MTDETAKELAQSMTIGATADRLWEILSNECATYDRDNSLLLIDEGELLAALQVISNPQEVSK